MNPAVILALIADLYAQVAELRDINQQLVAERDALLNSETDAEVQRLRAELERLRAEVRRTGVR